MQKATTQQLKEHNQRLVLKAIYTGQATSRAAVANETDLTRPTVSQIVGELLEVGLVHEKGPGASSGGKPPTLLSFTDDAYHVIGIHAGGQETFGSVTDLRGRILFRASQPTDDTDEESVLLGICQVLDELCAQTTRPLLGIGVSTPGLVDHREGVVRYSTHLNWRDVRLGERLAVHLSSDVPIYIDNDTNLAALGEQVFGVGDGVDNMVIVMVGNKGIGAGLILNGEVYHGAGGGAGEIGHMPVNEGRAACRCGQKGCLEAVASGWSLARRAKEAAAENPASMLGVMASDGLTVEDVCRAVQAGDATAIALAQDAGRYMGLALATLISTVNPQRVVVGGSVPELGGPYFDSLRCTVGEHTLALLADETEILPASLGPDANILGAVAQVLKIELGVA